jgi:hypothetical protein
MSCYFTTTGIAVTNETENRIASVLEEAEDLNLHTVLCGWKMV